MKENIPTLVISSYNSENNINRLLQETDGFKKTTSENDYIGDFKLDK